MLKKKAKKTIPDGEYRVIKVSKDAIFEFLYEKIIDNQEDFLDISDVTTISSCFDMNWETGEFICVAKNSPDDLKEVLNFDNIDTQKLISKLEDTTTTLYDDNRYIKISAEEMKKLMEE